jgi:hypothetical protein
MKCISSFRPSRRRTSFISSHCLFFVIFFASDSFLSLTPHILFLLFPHLFLCLTQNIILGKNVWNSPERRRDYFFMTSMSSPSVQSSHLYVCRLPSSSLSHSLVDAFVCLDLTILIDQVLFLCHILTFLFITTRVCTVSVKRLP